MTCRRCGDPCEGRRCASCALLERHLKTVEADITEANKNAAEMANEAMEIARAGGYE